MTNSRIWQVTLRPQESEKLQQMWEYPHIIEWLEAHITKALETRMGATVQEMIERAYFILFGE